MASATSAALDRDVLLHVIDFFDKPGNLRILATCARVCKAWCEPASRCLWRYLPSLHPLWYLLSNRNYAENPRMAAFWEFVDTDDFVKDVIQRHPDQWAHFLEVASFVCGADFASVSTELNLIRTVVKYNEGVTFLPSLHTLFWRHSVPDDTTCLLLCSPSLRSLHVGISRIRLTTTAIGALSNRITQFSPSLEPILSGLPAAAPNLERLTVSDHAVQNTVTFAPHIESLGSLHELVLRTRSFALSPALMRGILEHIPQLAALTTHIADFAEPGSQAVAPALRRLDLLESRSPDLVNFLESGFLRAPVLVSLRIRSTDDEYHAASAQVIPALAQASFAPRLHLLDLSISGDELVSRSPEQNPTFGRLVAPLRTMRELLGVKIALGLHVVSIDDSDLRALAQAWPCVQELELGWLPLGPRAAPPLVALRHFAALCPDLRSLTLTRMMLSRMEGSGVEEKKEKEKAHPLTWLNVKSFTGDDDPEAIARFLDNLFPNLELADPEPVKDPAPNNNIINFQHESSRITVEQRIRRLREARR